MSDAQPSQERKHPTRRPSALWLCALFSFSSGCAPAKGTIGAVLGQSAEGRLVLREVPPTLAAGTAGLKPGDEVLLIDGRDVREFDDRGVHRALSGEVGEPVKLTLLREGRVIRITLRRTPVPQKPG